jgi:transposase-like protein
MTTRRKYSREFKEESVKLITEQGYKVSEAARNLGINENMLGRWKQEMTREPESKSNLKWWVDSVKKREQAIANGARNLKKNGSLLYERIELRCELMKSTKKAYPIGMLCKVLKVSRSRDYK